MAHWRRLAMAILPGGVLSIIAGGAAAGPGTCPEFLDAQQVGTVDSAAGGLVELSGLAVSRSNPGVLWVHNDSGDTARVFALTTAGSVLGTFAVTGAVNFDWEDMAIGRGPIAGVDYLYIGDIGDNLNNRPNIRVYRVPEPAVDPRSPPGATALPGAQTITLVYPDGPRDAETLMVDINGDLYIVTKRVSAVGRVYRAAFPHSTSSTITLQFVASLPWGDPSGLGGATGGDIASDGSAVVVRRYSFVSPQATLWLRPPGTDLAAAFSSPGCNVSIAADLQGEAIAFAPDSLSYYTVSEGAAQPIYFYEHDSIPADLNGDGVVNSLDLGILLSAWSIPPAAPGCGGIVPCAADLNHDGFVNTLDLGVLLSSWTL